jgi:enamine deaminase RidA (YjgF/YER057c/UK114 family)
MELTRHDPASVSAPRGGYTHGLEIGSGARLLFISGQIPEAVDGTVPSSFDSQCRAAWSNIVATLASAGMTVNNLVKVTTFLTRQDQAEANGAIRREVLGAHRPALTVVVVQTLESQWLLEIDAIAAGDIG